ncbi:hypothetical protein Tco_1352823 [Tanacetum coccineum]
MDQTRWGGVLGGGGIWERGVRGWVDGEKRGGRGEGGGILVDGIGRGGAWNEVLKVKGGGIDMHIPYYLAIGGSFTVTVERSMSLRLNPRSQLYVLIDGVYLLTCHTPQGIQHENTRENQSEQRATVLGHSHDVIDETNLGGTSVSHCQTYDTLNTKRPD